MPATPVSEEVPAQSDAPATEAPVKLKYAVKTSLSLTLAYLLPMAMGWPQPQTAAITVMLIAATGLLSESLQKGVMRVLGTVAGAVIGLTLIALFPQDRMAYLLAVSTTVAIIIYLYNAYQGDSTVFMLTAVVTLMVFNGGDVEGSFLYGVDRAFMTAFGVIVYTLVASFLWPVKVADNTKALATQVVHGYGRSFDALCAEGRELSADDAQLTKLLSSEEAFQVHFASVKSNAAGVTDYLPEWHAIVRCFEELEAALVPALQGKDHSTPQFDRYIANYDDVVACVQAQFQGINEVWQGREDAPLVRTIAVEYRAEELRGTSHLLTATIASRTELLEKLQQVLLELRSALDSLLFNKGEFKPGPPPRGKPAFVWLDLENLKTAVRVFCTFWIAVAIWIQFNPPGGYTFVIMSTVLIPLVSFTPATPKLLFILFTLGFMFALPSYVFLLPQMTHWVELAIFIFCYAFIGFYVFPGPVAIFFLLGLFVLGIQNTMSYHVDVIMLIALMFYMVCAMQIISTSFPFTSKPERIYCQLRRRFFRYAASSIRLHSATPGRTGNVFQPGYGHGAILLTKLQTWGAKIDTAYFPQNSQKQLAQFNSACTVLQGQLSIQARRREADANNPFIVRARQSAQGNMLATLCDSLAEGDAEADFEQIQTRVAGIEDGLDELLGEDFLQRYDRQQLAQFYVYLNLQASILNSLHSCRRALQALNWQQLGDSKF